MYKNDNHIQPLVTIGVPVHNGDEYLDVVIRSLLSQEYSNFEVLLSNNASTDRTKDICVKYAEKDQRIKYFEHEIKMEMSDHFNFVLNQAKGYYFCFNGDDDTREASFLSSAVEKFLDCEGCVGVAPVDRISNRNVYRRFELVGEPYQRVKEYLLNAKESHGIFFSMYRTSVLREVDFRKLNFLGGDWAFNIHMLMFGEIRRVTHECGGIIIGPDGISSSPNRWQYMRKWYNWLLPFYGLSIYVVANSFALSIFEKTKLVVLLLKINLKAAKHQARFELKGKNHGF